MQQQQEEEEEEEEEGLGSVFIVIIHSPRFKACSAKNLRDTCVNIRLETLPKYGV